MIKLIISDLNYYRYLYGLALALTAVALLINLAFFPENNVLFSNLLTGAAGLVVIMILLATKFNRLGKQNLQIYRTPLSYNQHALARIFSFAAFWLTVIAFFLLSGAILKSEILALANLIELLKLSLLMIALMATYMIMLDLANLFHLEIVKVVFVLLFSVIVYFFNAVLAFSFAQNKFDYAPFGIVLEFTDTLHSILNHPFGLLWCLLYAVSMCLISIFTYNKRKTYLLV